MEDLQINDISNETGNIGQNQSTDSLFQPSNSNAGNLDLTFIDTAMTPLASSTTEPKESSTSTGKPSSYTEYWNKVSRGAPGLGIMARAAGGDSDSDDDDDVDSGWAGEGNENFERSFEKASKEHERQRSEREKAEKDRERARAEREAHEAEHSSGGETDTSPSGGSGSSSGGGASEYHANEADTAYSESSRATAASTAAMGKAQEAYDNYKETLANEKQAEATVRDITTKAQDAKELAQHTIDTFNEASQKLAEKENEIKNFGKEFLSGKSVDDSEVGNVTITDSSSGTVATAKEATVRITGPFGFGEADAKLTNGGKVNIGGKEYNKVTITDGGETIVHVGEGDYYIDPEGNVYDSNVKLLKDPHRVETVLEGSEKMRIAEEYNRLQTERRQLSADEAALQGPMDDAIAAYRQTQAELAKAQQELAQAQQAKQEALATATAAVKTLEAANAAAQEALDRYLNASKDSMTTAEDAGKRIGDVEPPIGDPEDNESAADALIISDDTWSREIKEVPDPLKGTPIGDCLQEYYDIFNNYDSEINEDAYQHWWNGYVTYIKSIWGKSNKESFFKKIYRTVKGTWSAVKEVKSIFKGRTEGHIVEFGKRCLGLLMNAGIAIMTGGASIPVQTSVTIVKQLWKNMKNEVVDSDLNQIMENPNSEGGEYEYYDTYKAIADDADAKWQLPSELGENYVAGKRSNNYSDYNYGLEGEDEQKGQLYSDEEIKDFITRVYRKSPTLYKLKIN